LDRCVDPAAFQERYRRIPAQLRLASATGTLTPLLAAQVKRCMLRMEGLGDAPPATPEAYNVALEGAALVEAISTSSQ
jgi:hypothetical protein